MAKSMTDMRKYNHARDQARRRLQTSPHRAHDLIRSCIRTGLFGENGTLEESALIRSLSTSRNAVRQALQMLASEGLLDRRPYRGTTVVREILDVDFNQLVPSTAFVTPRGHVREIDHRQIPGTTYIRRRLAIEDDIPVDMSEVLITVDHEPLSVRVSYIAAMDGPVQRGTEIVPFAEGFPLIFGVELGQWEASIGAVPAGPSTSRLLNIPEGTPLIVEEMLLRDVKGVPRELSYTHYRADRVALSVNQAIPHGSAERRAAG
jgi:GntR family transcriptional regulator